jgi:hypothetical protein
LHHSSLVKKCKLEIQLKKKKKKRLEEYYMLIKRKRKMGVAIIARDYEGEVFSINVCRKHTGAIGVNMSI